MNHTLTTISFVGMFLFMLGACQAPTQEKELQLGEVNLQVSGSKEAIPHFNKGLLLLHSFEYLDAANAFKKAQEIDKDFGMAYWGEAMAYNHNLWQRQLTKRAQDCFNRMGPDRASRLKLFETDLEKDLYQGIEILYNSVGPKEKRDLAYKKHMQRLEKKYPGNQEISALYAISLLGTAKNGRDEELYGKCAEISKGILAENPNHPGALHYLIHSLDDPEHAHLAVDAADKYAKVAPDAAHALHMPSHIYIALGRWKDVILSNIDSWNASMRRRTKYGMDGSYHSLSWLQYGLYQIGEKEQAKILLDKMKSYTDGRPSKEARAYLLAMKGAYMTENDIWDDAVADINIKVDDLSISKRGEYAFLEGMKAFYKNDKTKLQDVITQLKKQKYTASLNISEKQNSMCSAGDISNAQTSQLDIDMVSIMEYELEAALAQLNGQDEKALDLLKKASALDNTLHYAFGPPSIFKPADEAYAEALFKSGNYEAALTAFQNALKRNPGRLLSLQGKLKTAEALQNQALINEVSVEMEKNKSEFQRDALLWK